MFPQSGGCLRGACFFLVFLPTVGTMGTAWADPPPRRHGRKLIVNRARPVIVPNPAAPTTLGIFRPTPTLTIRGNDPVGGGYSPLGIYGDQTMALYGPFSPLRPATAPVLTYTRGYDGEVRLTEGLSSSYPNLPALSPVVYPTEANYYYAPRYLMSPREPKSAINWIDQR
jgi:hypothetical protein